MRRKKSNQVGWLTKVLIFAAILILLLIYSNLKGGIFQLETWKALWESLIPELLGPLIVFVLLYLIFVSQGININDLFSSGRPLWIANGYENYSQIDWNPYLQKSDKAVIVAFFFDEWIDAHDDALRSFLQRKDTRMSVYLPDYKDVQLLEEIHKLIPKYSPAQLTEKIKNSIEKVKNRTRQANKDLRDVDVRLYGRVFSYTLQAFDDNLFFSINELCREKDYKSPFIQTDLRFSKELKKFYEQEIYTLHNNSVEAK